MKKIIFTILILFLTMINCQHIEAKKKICRIGNFRYTYKVEEKGIWITKIKPLSNMGIATLKIPSRIKGKKVVKLGSDVDFDGEGDDYNIFGIRIDPDAEKYRLVPEDILNKVKKIKTIKIPSTVEAIAVYCFAYVQDGKTINIPEKINKYAVYQFTHAKWKKITVSAKNKKYKVTNGCLLSKDGTVLYGFVQKKKTMVIPETVKSIKAVEDNGGGDYNGCSTVVIPKGVNKIEEYAFETDKPVTIKIAKGNKRYAVQYGSVYSKVSGRLVLGYVNNGVLRVPEKVTYIRTSGILGSNLKKIIIPSGVKKIHHLLQMTYVTDLTCVVQSKKPPKLIDSSFGYDKVKLTVDVPKKCKNKYIKEWKFFEDVNVKFVER